MAALKDRRFGMVLTDEEERMIAELADLRGGLSASALVRSLIRQVHRAEIGDPPKTTKTKSTKGKKS